MNLNDEIKNCFPKIEELFSENTLLEFKEKPSDKLYQYHYGVGTWIRNHLLSDKDDLYHLFQKNGVEDRDDMSACMLLMFHIYLNKEKL